MVQARNIEDMSAKLGNPAYYEVNLPDEETRKMIDQ
jgi:hypothetical protein